MHNSNSILDSFIDLQESYNRVNPLHAIWLETQIITQEGKKRRIEAGDKVRVANGQLKDVSRDLKATHTILVCKGNISNSILQMDLQDLENGQIITINLK